MTIRTFFFLMCLALPGCDAGNHAATVDSAGAREAADATKRADGNAPGEFRVVGRLESKKLDEASGLQAGEDGVFFLHNDDGSEIFAIDSTGRDIGRMRVRDAKNKDWEDIGRIPGENGPLLVIGDTGDNHHARKSVRLYFIEEPRPGDFNRSVEFSHEVKVRYPGGPRDVESMAYDPASGMILLLSKRDQPPRLYGIPLDKALDEKKVEAEFLAEVTGFRPPTRSDIMKNLKRGMWVSQPTGMDISADGRMAAVITYRSLYLFHREDNETWAEAFQRQPEEFIGPPGLHDEAVSFGHDQRSIYVTTERRPAPLYRLEIPGL